jgi:hypothetical protein
MVEVLRTAEIFVTEPIVIDVRTPKDFLTAEDMRVDEQTFIKFQEHMDEGFYIRDLIYHGLVYANVASKNAGANCVNKKYTNVFIWDKGANHVYVIPPRK